MLTRLALVAALTLVASAAVSSTSSGGNVVHGARMAAPNHKISQSTSSNWSGYSAINGRYTTVSANWTQPTASCTSQTTYSSFWVGLDGDGSSTVEQTGTSADCSGGSPRYYAWYEMYPKFPVNLSIAVKPGDSMTGSVATDGKGRFTLTIHNNTTGGNFATTQMLKRARLASGQRRTHRFVQPGPDRHGLGWCHQSADLGALWWHELLGGLEALVAGSRPAPLDWGRPAILTPMALVRPADEPRLGRKLPQIRVTFTAKRTRGFREPEVAGWLASAPADAGELLIEVR